MFSKKTETMGLPQWEPKDHPDFLTDMNEAFRTIDATVQGLDAASPELVKELSDSVNALNDKVDASINELQNEVTTNTNAIEKLTNDTVTNLTLLSDQIEQVAQDATEEITAVDNRVTTINGTVEQHGNSLTVQAGEIATLGTEVSSNEARIDALENTISNRTVTNYGTIDVTFGDDLSIVAGGLYHLVMPVTDLEYDAIDGDYNWTFITDSVTEIITYGSSIFGVATVRPINKTTINSYGFSPDDFVVEVILKNTANVEIEIDTGDIYKTITLNYTATRTIS